MFVRAFEFQSQWKEMCFCWQKHKANFYSVSFDCLLFNEINMWFWYALAFLYEEEFNEIDFRILKLINKHYFMKIRTYLLLADDCCWHRIIFNMVSTFIAPSSNRVSKIQLPIRMISTSNFVRIWNAEKIYINDLGYSVISVFLSTKLKKNHIRSRCKS